MGLDRERVESSKPSDLDSFISSMQSAIQSDQALQSVRAPLSRCVTCKSPSFSASVWSTTSYSTRNPPFTLILSFKRLWTAIVSRGIVSKQPGFFRIRVRCYDKFNRYEDSQLNFLVAISARSFPLAYHLCPTTHYQLDMAYFQPEMAYPLTRMLPVRATMSENINPSLSGPDGKRKRGSLDSGDGQRMPRSPPMANANGNMHNQSNGNIHGAHHPYGPFYSDPSAHHVMIGYDTHGLNNPAELSIDQQLIQHVGGQNGVSDDNAMTAKAALAAHPQSKYTVPESAFDNNTLAHNMNTFGEEVTQVAMTNVHGHNSTAAAVYAAREAQSISQIKPPVGSPEWHTQRKNNHKEGECQEKNFPFISALLLTRL